MACKEGDRNMQRGITINIKRLSRRQLARDAMLLPDDGTRMPNTYGECERMGLGSAQMPCPFVSCQYHLYLDVNEQTGSIKLNFPDLDPDELAHTCAVRVSGMPNTLDSIAEMMNLTRERVRQIQSRALRALKEDKVINEMAGGELGSNDGPRRDSRRDFSAGGLRHEDRGAWVRPRAHRRHG